MSKVEVKVAFNDYSESVTYETYSNDSFDTFEFVRSINGYNDIPKFSLNESDGSITIIDKNKLIFERLKTNELKNYFITKVELNGNQIGEFVGINGKYPFNSNTLNYELNDYVSIFENISCDKIYFSDNKPLTNIYDGYQLYEELLNITTSKIENFTFEVLTQNQINYLQNYSFIDPFIDCSNLKEMWDTFLNAIMGNMFINDFGKLELNLFEINKDETIILIKSNQTNQDIDINLIPNNNISQVIVTNDYYLKELQNYTNGGLEISYINEEQMNFKNDNDVKYSTVIKEYINKTSTNKLEKYQFSEPSLFFKFHQFVITQTKEKTFQKVPSNLSLNNFIKEEYILVEGFIDLNDNHYTKNMKIKFKPTSYKSNIFILDNYWETDEEIEYEINWVSSGTYDNIKFSSSGDVPYKKIFIKEEHYLTKTGRLFKFYMPVGFYCFVNESDEVEYNKQYPLRIFKSYEIKFEINERKNIEYIYEEAQLYKSNLNFPRNSLLLVDKDEKEISIIVENYNLLPNIENENDLGTLAIVNIDINHEDLRTIYEVQQTSQRVYKWQFIKYDVSSRYMKSVNDKVKPITLSQHIAETIYEKYKYGRKAISFSTNNYDFYDVNGNLIYEGKKGQILKVGDIIQLEHVLNLKFKITKISVLYDGQVNIQVNGIEED